MIAEGLRDSDWRVRAVAAKEAHICPEEIIEPLEKALYDPNYHVRINAAQALKQMGERGLTVLTRNTTSSDRFVRDVTHYVLADKAYA
jgi:HEAT repeat protein